MLAFILFSLWGVQLLICVMGKISWTLNTSVEVKAQALTESFLMLTVRCLWLQID